MPPGGTFFERGEEAVEYPLREPQYEGDPPEREVSLNIQGDLGETLTQYFDPEVPKSSQQKEAAPGRERPDQWAEEEGRPIRPVIRGEVRCAMDTPQTTQESSDHPEQEYYRSAEPGSREDERQCHVAEPESLVVPSNEDREFTIALFVDEREYLAEQGFGRFSSRVFEAGCAKNSSTRFIRFVALSSLCGLNSSTALSRRALAYAARRFE